MKARGRVRLSLKIYRENCRKTNVAERELNEICLNGFVRAWLAKRRGKSEKAKEKHLFTGRAKLDLSNLFGGGEAAVCFTNEASTH